MSGFNIQILQVSGFTDRLKLLSHFDFTENCLKHNNLMLFKSMYIIYVNHDSVIKQICQLRDKAFLINETASLGGANNDAFTFYGDERV